LLIFTAVLPLCLEVYSKAMSKKKDGWIEQLKPEEIDLTQRRSNTLENINDPV
jgi:hypothetical protein